MKTGKVWGSSEEIARNPSCEMHHIRFKGGYQCSEHTHQSKWNGFYVLRGKMIVRVWNSTVDDTELRAGDYMQVPPGVKHQFIGVEDGDAIELYWAQLFHDDIVREKFGGKS